MSSSSAPSIRSYTILLDALPVSERGVGSAIINHLLLLLGPAQLWQEISNVGPIVALALAPARQGAASVAETFLIYLGYGVVRGESSLGHGEVGRRTRTGRRRREWYDAHRG